MKKNEKKGHKPAGYGVDDAEEWSVECGGTIIGLGVITKK